MATLGKFIACFIISYAYFNVVFGAAILLSQLYIAYFVIRLAFLNTFSSTLKVSPILVGIVAIVLTMALTFIIGVTIASLPTYPN